LIILTSLLVLAAPTPGPQATPSTAATFEVTVDRRVELVTTVLWYASDGKAFQGPVQPDIPERLKFYFFRFQNHGAITLARQMFQRGWTGEGAVQWALELGATPELAAPTDRPRIQTVEVWSADEEEELRAALARFYRETNFDGYLQHLELNYLGLRVRVANLLVETQEPNVPDRVIVAPLVGERVLRRSEGGKRLILLNPVAFPRGSQLLHELLR
jgi:hypothetical protein